jgi:hypothetical protein
MLNGDIQMLAGDVAHHRVAELMREAEADRIARRTRRSRTADRRGTLRRFSQAAIAAVMWPVRH